MSIDQVTVIKVRDVLMVTMPPDPDDATINALQENVLASMERHDPQGVILDISAVETLDSYFARTIVETVKMVSLMGGQTVIAGMQPAVAITATQLGFALGDFPTALDVDLALDGMAIDRPGRSPG